MGCVVAVCTIVVVEGLAGCLRSWCGVVRWWFFIGSYLHVVLPGGGLVGL